MLTRRHLRIKVLQILYAYYQSEEKDTVKTNREMQRSIDRIYDLYLFYLLILPELVTVATKEIETNLGKHRPTKEELSPDRRFVNNRIMQHFLTNVNLRKKSTERAINWNDGKKQGLMRRLLQQIKASANYQQYMSSTDASFETDSVFVQNLFVDDIANSEILQDFFEEESIYWMDDIDLVCGAVLKTIRTVTPESDLNLPLADLHRDEADEKEFVTSLFYKTLENDAESDKLIAELAKNWDLERLARMDIILLKMAFTEFTSISSIPKKVTLNEYIEISKFYSTPKSQQFINGILDKAIVQLEKDGKLIKTGRGLMN